MSEFERKVELVKKLRKRVRRLNYERNPFTDKDNLFLNIGKIDLISERGFFTLMFKGNVLIEKRLTLKEILWFTLDCFDFLRSFKEGEVEIPSVCPTCNNFHLMYSFENATGNCIKCSVERCLACQKEKTVPDCDNCNLHQKSQKYPVQYHENDIGDLMTLEEFERRCYDGTFIDYDGFGYYARGDSCSNVLVYPSDMTKGKKIMEFSHVWWFNR